MSVVAALVACLALGLTACASSPAAPSAAPTTRSTIDSVVTSLRGAVVTSSPVVVQPNEALQVEAKVTLDAPASSRVTMYFCVMETTESIGVGECAAMTDTVQGVQSRASVMGMGVRPRQTNGIARTTHYVYAGLTEGTIPWNFNGAAPPRAGETVGGSRVLAAVQLPRTVTFR
jgi:hypothetical protein